MLEGLEVSEIKLSRLENFMTIGAEYYAPEFLLPFNRLVSSPFKKDKLQQCCSLITDGDHGSADYAEEGVPFILSESVEEGRVRREACRFLTPSYAATLGRSKLQPGDVLVTKTGVYFGVSAVVDDALAGANTIAHVGILRLKAGLDPYFVSTFLNCCYGQVQLRRRGIKTSRPEIKLLEFDDIEVPICSERFQQAIRRQVLEALRVYDAILRHFAQAEQTLLRALGLEGWEPPEPLTYTRRASVALAAARFDAEYFAPRVAQLLAKLSADGLTIQDVAPARHDAFDASKHQADSFHYIEISGLRSDGTATSEPTPTDEAPSRASQKVHKGDIITSTVRPIRRLSAIIAPDQHEHVCSSGFVVLEPKAIAPEVLLTYLRLPIVCELMDLHTSASLYPAISERDLLKLPIPNIADKTAKEIITQVRQAHQSRQEAQILLRLAKQAVETAIEQGEDAALDELDDCLDYLPNRMGIPAARWRPDLTCDEVIACALRFDGGRLDEELQRRSRTGMTYGSLSARHEAHFEGQPWRLHPDPMVNWGEFLWLQRSGAKSGLSRPATRLAAWLFTQLHDQPVPRGYENAEYATQYARVRASAAALAHEWSAQLAPFSPSPAGKSQTRRGSGD